MTMLLRLHSSAAELSNPGEAGQMSVCAFRREKKELDHPESCYL